MVEFYAGTRRVLGSLALALLIQGGTAKAATGSTQGTEVQDGQQVPLKNVLAELEQLYKVRINYTGNTINGIITKRPIGKVTSEPLIDYLSNYLRPLGLEVEQAAQDHFIIYKKEKRSEKKTAETQSATEPQQPLQLESITQQQQPTVTGQVTEESGIPLPGVTVVVKGTFNGAKTNESGRYTLPNVPPNGTLVFSYIGYKPQEIKVNTRTSIDVKLLTDVQSMKDFVVNGYQKLKKESYTGSAIIITGDEIKRFNPQNILASIQAYDPSFRIVENNLTGSNPNALPNINIRGATAMPTGDAQLLSRNQLATITNLPMFMMDGYQVGIQTIYDLDVNRIEMITLLKDAAATSIYGSRASNGVVIIQTKTPKEGSLEVYYNYELNVTTPDLTAYKVLNASEKLEYEKLAGLYTSNAVDNPTDLEMRYYDKRKNVLSGVNTYWLSQPLATDFGHKHSVSLQGGSPTLRYGVDARYQTNNGVMKGSGRDRYSLATSLAYNLKDNKLMFRNSFTISQVKGNESPYGQFSSYVRMNPYYPKTDSLGRILKEVDKWNYLDNPDRVSGNRVALPVFNPLYEATTGNFAKSEYLEFIDAFSVEYNPSPSWRINGTISLTKRKSTADKFTSPYSNEFYYKTGDELKDRGRYEYANIDESQVDGSFTANYNKVLNGVHFLNFSLGTNIQAQKYTGKTITAQGFTNDRFTDITFARRYEIDGAPKGGVTEQRLIGAFLSFNYSYQNRFIMDGTVRTDGSSKFGKDSRMATFWSYGVGWNLHNEAFMKNSIFSQLRIKATTGLTGDVNFPAYLSNTTYSYYSQDWYSTGVGAVFAGYGNNSLRWQRTQNYDLSMEMSLFKDRLYISPRYYHKLTKDLLTDVNVPTSTGFALYKENLGEMVNKGFEFYLRANVLRGRDWSVNVNANLGHNTNVITKISNALKQYNSLVDDKQNEDSASRTRPMLRYKEGQSLNTIYAVRSLGIDPENGKEIYLRADGSTTYEYDVRNTVAVGDQTPDVDGYFGGNIVYKNFSVEFSFYTRLGGDIYNQTLIDRVENADPKYNVDSRVLALRWKKPGDHTFYKNIADLTTTRTTSRFVQEENRLEFKSVYMSYDAPAQWYKRLKMKSLRFALNLNDLAYWSSLQVERGIDYPFARSFTFSLSTRF
ncbi:SusC/RagA family TonB-linked outer membrane protein [Chitinophaga sp. SYP-B3965]|uniref:SusC/RagA family TonB-linked outer membrane protein n=1 Tax=Chitinophaga sp. SYP-B3965 TaxID=2663120 RepID=UPI0012996346|nr:SusC/RagA family TonB-linked outer membrane protein [Chitinophaga sp. SYP-B3965]MRG43775.1 SusC/RagA family TonB-linked outer membrane protein [Chitinophaga sp. SYP-B3965]